MHYNTHDSPIYTTTQYTRNTTTQYTPQYTLQYPRQPNIHDNITAVGVVLLQNCRTPSPSNAVAFDLVFLL